MTWEWLAISAGVVVLAWVLVVLGLLLAGRQVEARAFATFVPDCLVLFKRLLRDDRVPRGRKALLVGLVAYLAMPFDLVPDFIPIIGQLDDAILVALALRAVLRSGGRELVTEHWSGPEPSLAVVLALAGV